MKTGLCPIDHMFFFFVFLSTKCSVSLCSPEKSTNELKQIRKIRKKKKCKQSSLLYFGTPIDKLIVLFFWPFCLFHCCRSQMRFTMCISFALRISSFITKMNKLSIELFKNKSKAIHCRSFFLFIQSWKCIFKREKRPIEMFAHILLWNWRICTNICFAILFVISDSPPNHCFINLLNVHIRIFISIWFLFSKENVPQSDFLFVFLID